DPAGLQRRQGSNERIAPAGRVDDVSDAVLTVAEHLPQRRDVDAQVALLDIGVRPDQTHQLAVAEPLAAALTQRDEDFHRPAPQAQRLVGLKQDSLLWQEPIWPEGDAFDGFCGLTG